jgi:hypothetical protein
LAKAKPIAKTALIMKTRCFVPLPDPVQENRVTLSLRWTADSRTARAIKRQAKLMGAILGGGSIPFTH